MLTVACVWVQANVPYSVDYVIRLRSMVRRHLQLSHEFICLTDRPGCLPADVETVRIATPCGAGWWAKLELFNPAHGLRGEGLYLDLDVLLVGSIADIARWDPGVGGLVLLPHAGTFEGRGGRKVIKRYNSSVMRLRFGASTELWSEWQGAVAARLWGDQDWIGERLPNLPTMPSAWFPRLSQVERPPCWPKEAKVILCKVPKNHVALERWTWFGEWWK